MAHQVQMDKLAHLEKRGQNLEKMENLENLVTLVAMENTQKAGVKMEIMGLMVLMD